MITIKIGTLYLYSKNQYLLVLGKYVPAGTRFKRAIIHLTTSGAEIMQLPDMTSEIKDMIIHDAMDFRL